MSFQNTGPAVVLSNIRKKESVAGACFHFFSRQRGFDEGRWAFEDTLIQSMAMISKVFFSDAEFTPSAGVWLPCSL
jgi:hypothetical protein